MTCYSKPYEGSEPYIFFSYCHSDEAKVYSIIERMNLEGYRVWYDDGIHPGDDWPDVVAEHLDAATICVASMSKMSSTSHNCKNEVSFAISQNKPLVSIVLEKFNMPMGMRLQMSASNYINYFEYEDDNVFFERLFSSAAVNTCRNEGLNLSKEQLRIWKEHKEEYLKPVLINEKKVDNWFVTKPNAPTAETEAFDAEMIIARECVVESNAPIVDDNEGKNSLEIVSIEPLEIDKESGVYSESIVLDAKKEDNEIKEPHINVEATPNEHQIIVDNNNEDVQVILEYDDEKTICDVTQENDNEKTIIEEDDEKTVIEVSENTTSENDEFEKTIVIPKVKRPNGAIVHIETGTVYKFSSIEVTIGRSNKSSQIAIGDEYGSVGRHHADVFVSSGNYFLKDNNSTNGTSVNGKTLEKGETVKISSFDLFQLAEESFVFFGKDDIRMLEAIEKDGTLALLVSEDTHEIQPILQIGIKLDRGHKWSGGALSDTKISRAAHAEIVCENNEYYLTDVGSKNGTFVGMRRLEHGQKMLLHNGEKIRIADTVFQFMSIKINEELFEI